jgi:glycyl-tRNA synthetase beta chain
MSEFILELFSEEIPARFQKQAAEDLKRLLTEKLGAEGLPFETATTYVTPRRLTAHITGLPQEQAARSEEKKGPKEDAPQAAIEGFLKSAGVASLDQCELRDTPKGKVWFYVQTLEGRKTADVLRDLIAATIREMPWKKSMTWGCTSFRWVRPLHSILAVFDGQLIDGQFDLGGEQKPIIFTDHAQGHRFLGEGSFKVVTFEGYVQNLHDQGVILDREQRKQLILDGATALLAEKGLTLKQDDALLEEVCGLVEWPVPMLGQIDADFMSIPPEVLITSMRVNQKYFTAVDSTGKMAPYFVLVSNVPAEDGGATIIHGNERVLRARLSDARFFWDTDRMKKLKDYNEALENITFHNKLGSIAVKVGRVQELAESLKTGADKIALNLAGKYFKSDLVTGMVGEFPELQGIMGGYYARHENMGEDVALAIAQHYSPQGPNDICPTNPVAATLALADKIDTLVGFFGIDEKPTGSKDPYALRRAALGVLRIVLENNLAQVDLLDAINTSSKIYTRGYDVAFVMGFQHNLFNFLLDRFKQALKDQGYSHEIISSILKTESLRNIVLTRRRLEHLREQLATERGKEFLQVHRRAINFLRDEEKRDKKTYTAKMGYPRADEAPPQTPQRDFFFAINDLDRRISNLVEKDNFEDALEEIFKIIEPVSLFLNQVTINDEAPEIREENLSLLAKVRKMADMIADFSQIEGDAPAPTAKAA